ncbi:MAG: hypothetical protein AAF718_15240 [Pseudomonadota bacterium]
MTLQKNYAGGVQFASIETKVCTHFEGVSHVGDGLERPEDHKSKPCQYGT